MTLLSGLVVCGSGGDGGGVPSPPYSMKNEPASILSLTLPSLQPSLTVGDGAASSACRCWVWRGPCCASSVI